jgi:hypothetical protein
MGYQQQKQKMKCGGKATILVFTYFACTRIKKPVKQWNRTTLPQYGATLFMGSCTITIDVGEKLQRYLRSLRRGRQSVDAVEC